MKKILLLAVMAVASISLAVAQPRAIGGNVGYGVDFSYQHGLGEKNMVDLSVNVPAFAGLGATCTYDWINPFNTSIPWDKKGEWCWEMGVGAGLGMYGFKYPIGYAGVVGHIGVEYHFWFPMALSVDYRPNFGVAFDKSAAVFNTPGLYTGITLGIRYLF